MDTATESVDTTEDVSPEPEAADVEVPAQEPDEQKTPVERPQQSTRQARKQQRIDVEAAQRQAAEVRQQLEMERIERTRMAQELAEVRAHVEAGQRQSQTQSRAEQAKSKITQLRDQAWMHMERAAVAKDAQSALHERQEYQRLMDEAEDTRREIWAEQERERIKAQMWERAADPALLEEKMYLSSRYPELETNVELRSLADGRFNALVTKGRQPSRQLMEEAITYAAAKLGIGGQSAPTDAQRQRYAGIPGGEGAGGGNERRTIKMGRHEEAMAKAAYPQLEAKDAFRQWAKDVAARLSDED